LPQQLRVSKSKGNPAKLSAWHSQAACIFETEEEEGIQIRSDQNQQQILTCLKYR